MRGDDADFRVAPPRGLNQELDPHSGTGVTVRFRRTADVRCGLSGRVE